MCHDMVMKMTTQVILTCNTQGWLLHMALNIAWGLNKKFQLKFLVCGFLGCYSSMVQTLLHQAPRLPWTIHPPCPGASAQGSAKYIRSNQCHFTSSEHTIQRCMGSFIVAGLPSCLYLQSSSYMVIGASSVGAYTMKTLRPQIRDNIHIWLLVHLNYHFRMFFL